MALRCSSILVELLVRVALPAFPLPPLPFEGAARDDVLLRLSTFCLVQMTMTSHSSALCTLIFRRFQQHRRRHGCSPSHRLRVVTLDVTTTDVNQLRTRRVIYHKAALQPITVSCAQYTMKRHRHKAIIRPAEKNRKRGKTTRVSTGVAAHVR